MVTAVKRPAGETRGKVAAGPQAGEMPPRQLPTLQRLSATPIFVACQDLFVMMTMGGRDRRRAGLPPTWMGWYQPCGTAGWPRPVNGLVANGGSHPLTLRRVSSMNSPSGSVAKIVYRSGAS
jgi:hypothetical protein